MRSNAIKMEILAWPRATLTSSRASLRLEKQYMKPDRKVIGATLALGISPFIMASTESLVGFVLNGMLKTFGDIYVSALTVMQSSMLFVSVPLTGFALGFVPIIVANAAPFTPMLKPKMKSGSSMILRKAPRFDYYPDFRIFIHCCRRRCSACSNCPRTGKPAAGRKDTWERLYTIADLYRADFHPRLYFHEADPAVHRSLGTNTRIRHRLSFYLSDRYVIRRNIGRLKYFHQYARTSGY